MASSTARKSIARSKPKFGLGKKAKEFKRLAPPWPLLLDYKSGKCDWAQYEVRFKRDVLANLDRDLTIKELQLRYGPRIHLLCWELKDKHCHRRLVLEWLNA